MNFRSDYEKLKYNFDNEKRINKIKSERIVFLEKMVNDLRYKIEYMNSKLKKANHKNEQLSLLLDEYLREMRELRNGKTKNNK